MTDETEKTQAQEDIPEAMPVTVDRSPMGLLVDQNAYTQLKAVAKTFASSQLVPKHFRDKPADVFIALHMAHRLGADPIMVLQNLYIVHGNPGWSAKFIIAQANAAKSFRGPIRFRYDESDANNLRVTAHATMADTGEEVSSTVDLKMARAEGWTKSASGPSKYDTMPHQMLSYRAATFLVRLYCPEVLLGVPVVDELVDIHPTPPPGADAVTGIDTLKAKLAARKGGEVIDRETGEITPAPDDDAA